jgi:hypothetical protein
MKAELDRIEAEAALLKAAGDEWDAERQRNRAAELWTSIRRTVPTSCAGMIGQLEILPGSIRAISTSSSRDWKHRGLGDVIDARR